MPLNYRQFDPQTATDADYDAMIDCSMAENAEFYPDDPQPSREYLRVSWATSHDNPVYIPNIEIAMVDGEAIGFCGLWRAKPESPDYAERKHVAEIMVYVLPQHRRKGYGTAMLHTLIEQCRAHNLTMIQSYAIIADGKAFAAHYGATTALEEAIVRLNLDAVDWAMVATWHEQGAARNPDTMLLQYDGLYSEDDAELAKYADAFSELDGTVPEGELEAVPTTFTPERFRISYERDTKRGILEIGYVSIEADGTISGITNAHRIHDTSHLIEQGLTGVRESHQGRGLGKWLKAAILLHLRDRYPDAKYIETGNAIHNAPMRHINEKLGFYRYMTETAYKITVDDLAARLG